MKRIVIRLLKDFLSLVFPRICHTCGNDLKPEENLMCTRCEYDLPKTLYHRERNNPVEQIFWGRAYIEYGTAYFFYQKGSKYQKLIHDLKYKGKKFIGYEMGKKMASELFYTAFSEADLVVPVPLHPKKQQKRGYNQSDWIVWGISEKFGIPAEINTLYRKTNNQSQTKKSRFDRWQNVKDVFEVKDKQIFSNKHVLLVDDVITTGATIEACINQLLSCPNCKVSVLSLGYSKN